jgi:hypothetical protein
MTEPETEKPELRKSYTHDELKFYELSGLPVSRDDMLPIFGKCDQLDNEWILARKTVFQAVVRDGEGNPGIVYMCPACMESSTVDSPGLFTIEDAIEVSAERFINKPRVIHTP